MRKGPGTFISNTFPFEGQRPYLITASLENFVTTIPVKADLVNVGYSWTPKEPYNPLVMMPHPFLSPPLCSSPQGLLQVRPAWSQTEPQGKDRVASEVMCRVQGPGSRSDAHSFSVSGWSVFGLCLKHKHNSSLILVSYPSQVLNYPINKIHLVFDLWKIFLYG